MTFSKKKKKNPHIEKVLAGTGTPRQAGGLEISAACCLLPVPASRCPPQRLTLPPQELTEPGISAAGRAGSGEVPACRQPASLSHRAASQSALTSKLSGCGQLRGSPARVHPRLGLPGQASTETPLNALSLC